MLPDTRLDAPGLAACAASSLVLTADTAAQGCGPEYWLQSRHAHRSVATALAEVPDSCVRELSHRLLAEPASAPAYRQFVAGAAAYFGRPAGAAPDALAGLIAGTGRRSRLRISPGAGSPASGPLSCPDELLSRIRHGPHRNRGPLDVAVVIPFRAARDDGRRVRNLAAALNALSDQSFPRQRYRIVVAESDAVPRWRHLFRPVCDAYVFAPCPGRFSKSWAVNAGVVHGAGAADLICVLDGDILVDSDFIGRGVARFERSGVPAHLPFRDVLFLDEQASLRAVAARCVQGRSRLDHSTLRGVYLRRPPGTCVWLSARTFAHIGGMDERFSGWGGEDQDFIWRIERHVPLRRYSDPMMHLNHARAPHRAEDGRPFHAEIRFCSWPGGAIIGDLRKYFHH